MRICVMLCAVFLAGCEHLPQHPFVIRLVPDKLALQPGDNTYVQLVVIGLAQRAPLSLGAFAVTINWDEAPLQLQRTEFGDGLNPADYAHRDVAQSVQAADRSVRLSEVSALAEKRLDSRQRDGFVLATLHFTATRTTSATLALQIDNLVDAAGNKLTMPALPFAEP